MIIIKLFTKLNILLYAITQQFTLNPKYHSVNTRAQGMNALSNAMGREHNSLDLHLEPKYAT